ncbi:DUF4333 domain-containing protein [Mycolicibacterium llatzerense]|uniref:DUF4333 domain-containing protein n=1 Tax=Mycolicibacterium llatzerense TaxID=280871 RepID=UPI0008DCEAA9|nr:DUF4333 domain-containing protein [Mycolicibacterium llatzerense]
MTRIPGRVAAALVIGFVAVQLTACTSKIKPEGAAQSVTDLVISQTRFHPTDVKCPSGVDAKVGGEFDCTFTGPEGPYKAHLKITSVDGEKVGFDIKTSRS